MDYAKRRDLEYKSTKQYCNRKRLQEVNFNLQHQSIYPEESIADFISPAIRNLGLVGAGLGGLKGALEPQVDDIGQPIGVTGRLGNIAANTLGGGLVGAGIGLGFDGLRGGAQQVANTVADSVRNAPNAVSGKPSLSAKLQNLANSDISTSPTRVHQTAEAFRDRANRDKQRVKRFFTGRGAGVVEEARPVGKTVEVINPVTNEKTTQFIPTRNKFGDEVTETVSRINPDAQLDKVSGFDRTLGSIAGGVAGIPFGPVGVALGGTAGAAAGVSGGVDLGKKAIQGTKAAAGATKELGARARDLTKPEDFEKIKKGIGSGLSSLRQRATDDIQRTRNFFGFEYPQYQIVSFMGGCPDLIKSKADFSTNPDLYKALAIGGVGLGGVAGATNSVADTLNRQRLREEQELEDITNIDNPYIRMGTYRDYTSPDETRLRNLRNAGDTVARGALGAAVGGAAGLGLGTVASKALENQRKSKGLLGRLR